MISLFKKEYTGIGSEFRDELIALDNYKSRKAGGVTKEAGKLGIEPIFSPALCFYFIHVQCHRGSFLWAFPKA